MCKKCMKLEWELQEALDSKKWYQKEEKWWREQCMYFAREWDKASSERHELWMEVHGDMVYIVGKEPTKPISSPTESTDTTKKDKDFRSLLDNPEAAWKEIMGQKGGAQ